MEFGFFVIVALEDCANTWTVKKGSVESMLHEQAVKSYLAHHLYGTDDDVDATMVRMAACAVIARGKLEQAPRQLKRGEVKALPLCALHAGPGGCGVQRTVVFAEMHRRGVKVYDVQEQIIPLDTTMDLFYETNLGEQGWRLLAEAREWALRCDFPWWVERTCKAPAGWRLDPPSGDTRKQK